MTITLEAKPLEYVVEIPSYGIFKVRRMGAGLEADLLQRARELNEMLEQFTEDYGAITKKEEELLKSNDETALAKLRASEDYQKAKAAQKQNETRIMEHSAHLNECKLKLWSSDDEEALNKLLNDFTTRQLDSLYTQVIAQADNAIEEA